MWDMDIQYLYDSQGQIPESFHKDIIFGPVVDQGVVSLEAGYLGGASNLVGPSSGGLCWCAQWSHICLAPSPCLDSLLRKLGGASS